MILSQRSTTDAGIEASVPALAHALEEVWEQHAAKPLVEHATEAVVAVFEHKSRALAFLHARHPAQASAQLQAALALERDLAAWADSHHLSFEELGK